MRDAMIIRSLAAQGDNAPARSRKRSCCSGVRLGNSETLQPLISVGPASCALRCASRCAHFSCRRDWAVGAIAAFAESAQRVAAGDPYHRGRLE
eukprot:6564267-Alexandrium_andersonii.AAC.1